MWAETKKPGFTIVELLIVIVVIGILAAITIVTYSGIQARAENAKTIAALNDYSNGLGLYQAANGIYPVATNACFGASDGICSQVTDGGATCFGLGGTTSKPVFDTAMTTSLGKLPQSSIQRMNCGGKNYAGGFYNSGDGKVAVVYYYLKGNQPCLTIGIFSYTGRAQQDDTTLCTAALPILP
jgi:prepilin-type N-terminal cleavage/methylation domain-containing protein